MSQLVTQEFFIYHSILQILELSRFVGVSIPFLSFCRNKKSFMSFHGNVFSFSIFIFMTGALPFVTASLFCFSGFIKWLTIISYCILCLFGLHKALCAGSPWQRRLCFALPFLVRVMLQLLRISGFGGGNPNAMLHVFLQVSKVL